MALSKPVIPDTIQDMPVIAQHFLICDTEDCDNNCQFYCNPCHQPICEQCRDEHQKKPYTKNHEVVPYRLRKRKLPVEKCKDHPSKDIDMICENCQVAVCSKCAIKNHRGHIFDDLETIYSERFTLCLKKIYDINQYYLPTSQDMKRDVKEDVIKMKAFMNDIRESMKAEAESLKHIVEKAKSDNLEQANKMEETLLEKLRSKDKTYEEYNDYLDSLVNEFQGYLSFDKVQNNPLLLSLSEDLNIKPIPKSTEPVYPIFTASQYSKDDITKLMSRITAPKTKSEKTQNKPIETTSTHLKLSFSGKQIKQNEKKLIVTKELSLSPTVTEFSEYSVPVVERVYHISLGKSGRLWASDRSGNLVQTNQQTGKKLKIIKTNGESDGYHTVTREECLIYTDKKNSVFHRIKIDSTITGSIKTGHWEPISIHSSKITEDLLVGMSKDGEGKATIYKKTGTEILNIESNRKGQRLLQYPHYITENTNGDVCVSDYSKEAVVVVNKSGQHRFSYTGQGSKFIPYGICTDILGHILVCDCTNNTVHLLDQDGQFLSQLLTREEGVEDPLSVCVDELNNLHVGQYNTNKVKVFKFLQ